jgi:hypothetical protein
VNSRASLRAAPLLHPYKALTVSVARLYCAGSLLKLRAICDGEPLASAMSEKNRCKTFAVNPMIRNPDFDYLFVLLTVLAVAFMLWVFWNLSKQIGRRRDSAQAEITPASSSAVQAVRSLDTTFRHPLR